MARTQLMKTETVDRRLLAAGARIRARALALIHAAMRESSIDQTTLAARLGIRKAAVNALLRGNGNVRLDSLAEYMGALGYELDLTAVKFGEIDAARENRRAPHTVCLTLSDRDRLNNTQGHMDVVALSDHARRAMNTVREPRVLETTHEIAIIGIPVGHRAVRPASVLDAYKKRIDVRR